MEFPATTSVPQSLRAVVAVQSGDFVLGIRPAPSLPIVEMSYRSYGSSYSPSYSSSFRRPYSSTFSSSLYSSALNPLLYRPSTYSSTYSPSSTTYRRPSYGSSGAINGRNSSAYGDSGSASERRPSDSLRPSDYAGSPLRKTSFSRSLGNIAAYDGREVSTVIVDGCGCTVSGLTRSQLRDTVSEGLVVVDLSGGPVRFSSMAACTTENDWVIRRSHPVAGTENESELMTPYFFVYRSRGLVGGLS